MSTIQKGYPERNSTPPGIGVFYHMRDELAVTNGLIYRGDRLVIPKEMRNTIMKDIHMGHSGVDGRLRLARDYVYWLGMSEEIKQTIQNCEACRELGSNEQR